MSKEESVAQAVCLYELSTKRTLAGLKTFICFIELNKAYDSVPHEACLKKIEDFGIRGRALTWISKLYENPSIGCRTPDGTTPPRPYRRGLKQGDPLSPILFNIFINDIIDQHLESLGIEVNGQKICALMFADDIAFISDSITKCPKYFYYSRNGATIGR